MKKLILIFSLLFSTAVLAKKIKLNISTLYKDGQGSTKERSFSVVALLGKEWVVPLDKKGDMKLKMNVKEKIDLSSELLMDGKITFRKDGKEEVFATPKILSLYDHEAIMSTDRDDGKYIELRITALKE